MRAWRVGVIAETEYNRRVRRSAFIALALAVSAGCSPYVNRGEVLYREGRYIEPGRPGEVMVGEAFALAHQLRPGDKVRAVLNGRYQELNIVARDGHQVALEISGRLVRHRRKPVAIEAIARDISARKHAEALLR